MGNRASVLDGRGQDIAEPETMPKLIIQDLTPFFTFSSLLLPFQDTTQCLFKLSNKSVISQGSSAWGQVLNYQILTLS